MADHRALEIDPSEPLIGGRYRILRVLGKGGMGSVFEADNVWIKRRVALKVMRAEIAANEVYAQRFLREAQAAASLSHPNIVDVLDMGRDEETGYLYIVQEFLTGHDLRRHLEAAGRLPVGEAIALIMPVMEALVVAHAHGIVHRDLKPDNIFLSETPRGVVPKLIDFGIAKLTDSDADSLQKTQTGVVLGTPYFMSPEQACGESDLDARSDIWSLGVVLYTMLAGIRPYQATTSHALIAKIIYELPRPLDEAASDLPRPLVDVVMTAIRKKREDRYATMQAFLEALRACPMSAPGWAPEPIVPVVPFEAVSPTLVVSSGDLGLPPEPAALPAPTAPAPERHAPASARRSRAPFWLIVLGVVSVAALVVRVTLLTHRSPAPVEAVAHAPPPVPAPPPLAAPVVVSPPVPAPPPLAAPVVVSPPMPAAPPLAAPEPASGAAPVRDAAPPPRVHHHAPLMGPTGVPILSP